MLGKLIMSCGVLILTACVATPVRSPENALSSSTSPRLTYDGQRADVATPTITYSPIEITPAMKAGLQSTRPFELIYALNYATARTDRQIPATFGGLSSILFSSKSSDQITFEVISDQGHFGLLNAPDAMVSARQLTGTTKVLMKPLRGPNGGVLAGANDIDAEGLARVSGGRMVSLERNHRLLRVSDSAAYLNQATVSGPTLTGFEGLEPNGGMEALVALPDGRFLAAAEYGRSDQGSEAARKAPYWIFSLDQGGPIAPVGTFENSGGFGVTEARVMDNDLWLLKREYDFTTKITKARLERCPLAGVIAGAPLCTLELTLEPPFAMDNYEGLEIFKQAETGDLFFYILSDDNFSAEQRTIMLAFRLASEGNAFKSQSGFLSGELICARPCVIDWVTNWPSIAPITRSCCAKL